MIEADGTDPEEAFEKTSQAVASARAGNPTLLHLTVLRLPGHASIDDQSYKTQKERRRDQAPIVRPVIFDLEDGLPKRQFGQAGLFMECNPL